MNKCDECSTETKNPKFCSRSCSAKQNNKVHPKRKKLPLSKKCKGCDTFIRQKWTWCETCKTKEVNKDETLRELQYTKGFKSNGWTKVRTRARNKAKKLGWNKCSKCSYDKHIEICHIKAIRNFSLDSKISEVNSEDNLCALCPNCHWEFDHIPQITD